MKFGEIDIPDELIDAQKKNELVIFAGAGVSKASPSNLPLFDEFADRVERRFGEKRSVGNSASPNSAARPDETIDEFLERVKNKDSSALRKFVHSTYDIQSPTNALQRNLLRLFCPDQQVRIVTSNYDRLLSKVILELGIKNIQSYVSPSLPLDDRQDFAGIAYIHGSVEEGRNLLIYTQSDFAAAYMSVSRWTYHFISHIFNRYTVLFVGYSLGDTLVRYLMKAETKRGPAFALCVQEAREWWNQYDVTPVPYQVIEGPDKHYRIREALRLWSENTQKFSQAPTTREIDYIKTESEVVDVASGAPPRKMKLRVS